MTTGTKGRQLPICAKNDICLKFDAHPCSYTVFGIAGYQRERDILQNCNRQKWKADIFSEQSVSSWSAKSFAKVELELDVWMNTHFGNEQHQKLILRLCKNVQTKDSETILVGRELEIWLPQLSKA